MSAVFSTVFIVAVIGFLAAFGVGLHLLERRISRLEAMQWKQYRKRR